LEMMVSRASSRTALTGRRFMALIRASARVVSAPAEARVADDGRMEIGSLVAEGRAASD
jgi:hypothetical protein